MRRWRRLMCFSSVPRGPAAVPCVPSHGRQFLHVVAGPCGATNLNSAPQQFSRQVRPSCTVRRFHFGASELFVQSHLYTLTLCVCVCASGSQQKEDYYKTLGVPRSASQKEIKKAYYEVCGRCHKEECLT